MRPAIAALGLAFLMVVVVFAIPARPAQAADLTGRFGGTLRTALLAAPSWDPLSTNPADAPVHNLVWDTLARPDPATGEPKPWAATGWTPNKIGATNNGNITVALRPGLKWSDGTPITAADVARTFGPSGYGFATSVWGNDVNFTFTGGAGRFYSVALYGWVAWNAAGQVRYSGLFAPSPTNSSLLLANTNYWAGRPFLDSVGLVTASSVDDAACRLLKKRVDLIGFALLPNDLSDERTCTAYGGFQDPLGNPLNKSLVNANATRAEPHVSAVHHPGPQFMYYWTNVAGGGAMADVNFRRALYLLVNKQLAGQIEPSSAATHSLVNREIGFWFLPSWEVIRDAGFTTIRDPLGTPRQDTNPFPGAQALDMAGYLDRNGDGWRETPAGGALTLRIGVVGFNVDPRKTTIMGAYVTVLQRQGVNANLVTFPTWASLRQNETAGTIQVALETADLATANPRFMETFSPLQAASLLTDSDARNVITHTNLGKNSFTLTERRLHFNHVTYYNSLSAIVLPVLHYQTLEAFDRDAFTGWVDSYGGINNVWSFANLMQPPRGPLTIGLSTFTRTVTAGGNTTVQVVVSDSGGAAVKDATVQLTPSTGTLDVLTGLTDANGRFSAKWTAPAVTQDTDVTIWATVSKPQYTGGSVSTSLTAHPPFRPLDVTVAVSQSVLGAGNATTVTVTVRSSGGAAVGSADVSLTVSLPGGKLTAYSGTSDPTTGVFTTTFTAFPSVRSIYRIDATASKAGYAAGSGTGSVIVTPQPIRPQDYTRINVTQNVPGFEALAVIAALGAAVAILRWRNRREG